MPRPFSEFLRTDWPNPAYRHLRNDPDADVLDFQYAGLARDNRWNHVGEPTLYLASDPNVAVGEYSRHLELDRAPLKAPLSAARRLYEMRLHNVGSFLDLRAPELWDALHLRDEEDSGFRVPWYYEKRRTRAVAAYLRHITEAKGLIVPSMAFLDAPHLCCLVLFLEKLPTDPRNFLAVENSVVITIG